MEQKGGDGVGGQRGERDSWREKWKRGPQKEPTDPEGMQQQGVTGFLSPLRERDGNRYSAEGPRSPRLSPYSEVSRDPQWLSHAKGVVDKPGHLQTRRKSI